VTHADHPTIITYQHALQCGLEGPTCLSRIPAELGNGRLAALVIAGEGASSRRERDALASNSSVSASMSAMLRAAQPRLTRAAFGCSV
jgi:hypothetical protein